MNHKALIELPRDHGKSTQVCARLVWELARNPALRIKVVCASDALAAERGRFVRQAIEGNANLHRVFPRLRPDHPWGDTRLTVVRPANVIGPSLTAIGVGAASTGSRADLLVCDDIVDVKALCSRAERDRVKDYFRDNLMNLLEPDGRFWGLCTPWHRDDLNAELKRNGAYALFRRAVGDDLEPVWPERWPEAALAARRDEIGTVSFARGYRLVPLADEDVPIRATWVRFWDTEQEPDRVILSVDPALSTHARADRSALVVLARCGNQVRCLDAIARRVSTPDLLGLIGVMHGRWNPDVIVFESNGAFKGITELMTRHTSYGPKVKEVKQTTDKASRVATFGVPVENGSFLLKGDGAGGVDLSQQELMDEMTTFPLGEHDDLLDAAATGTGYLLGKPEPRVWVL
jgi:phage terminase large subunit-like protein